MIFYALIFLAFTWVTFKKYPSPALILSWMFAGIGVMTYVNGTSQALMMVSFILYIIVLSITAMVTGGEYQ